MGNDKGGINTSYVEVIWGVRYIVREVCYSDVYYNKYTYVRLNER